MEKLLRQLSIQPSKNAERKNIHSKLELQMYKEQIFSVDSKTNVEFEIKQENESHG